MQWTLHPVAASSWTPPAILIAPAADQISTGQVMYPHMPCMLCTLCFLRLNSNPVSFQEHAVDIPAGHGSSQVPPTRLIDPSADQAVQPKSQGLVLYWRQFWALFVKRAISAKRDRLAVVLQLLVPILLVLLALRAGNASSAMVQEPSLDISRYGQRCVRACMRACVCVWQCVWQYVAAQRLAMVILQACMPHGQVSCLCSFYWGQGQCNRP